jgi:D-3-phosphoglycerate dehydrogenase / 2-oxoglutarate reductase
VKNGKILLIDTFHPSFSNALSEEGFNITEGYQLSKEEIMSRIDEWDGIAIRSRFKLDKEFLSEASTLKFIARGGAGMENIDVNFAESKGIHCLSAPEGNRDAVGEQALGMLLMLMNNLLRSDREVRKGKWNREKNRGHELQGKTVGIIGFGNMGSAFAQRLAGFDVKILVYDKYVQLNNLPNHVQQVSMEELYRHCDVVSLHLPLTSETTYFANTIFFDSFSKPIWFVNTARGKNTDTSALVTAIDNGKVRGAALDVIEYEAVSFEDIDSNNIPAPLAYLFESDKTVLSPHIAGWTFESHEKIAAALVKKILAL